MRGLFLLAHRNGRRVPTGLEMFGSRGGELEPLSLSLSKLITIQLKD